MDTYKIERSDGFNNEWQKLFISILDQRQDYENTLNGL